MGAAAYWPRRMISATSFSSRVACSSPPTAERSCFGCRISSTSPYSSRSRSTLRCTMASRPSAVPAPRARWTMSSICTSESPPVSDASSSGVSSHASSGAWARRWRANSARAERSGRGIATTSAPDAPAYTSSETSCADGAMRMTSGRRAAIRGSALGRAGSPRGSQGVRVVDHDRHRARGTALGREHRVEHDEGAGGIGGEQPLEAEGFAQRLLPVRVGKGQAGGHVVGGDDGAPPREALESFAQRHPIPTEDVEVAHVAVEQEEMARAGVVALEHARRQPRRDLQRLHGVSRRP